jgi:curved DNA-binding protein CbpA
MRPPTPDYYGILGLAQTATPEEIKKRYRELARRYHPDVAKTPDAANKFKEINEANRVLSDSDSRARYDSELKLARLKAPLGERGRGGEGEKRTQAGPRPSPGTQRPAGQAQQRPKPSTAQTVPAAVIDQAQKALSRMKYREAEAICRQALRTYGRSAPIYEILGDICRVRGRTDEAIAMYSYALQLDRTNRSVQAKFDKLVGRTDSSSRPSGATVTGTAARNARRAVPRNSPAGHGSHPPGALARAFMNLFGAGLVCLLVYVGARVDHAPATNWKVFTWDPLLLFALVACGGIVGFLMSLNGLVGVAKAELSIAGPQGRRSFPTLLGALLVLYSVALFYAGFVYFVVVGFFRQAISRSVLTAYAACFLLNVVFAIVEQTSRVSLMLFGGNLVFAGYLVGWAGGDRVRR